MKFIEGKCYDFIFSVDDYWYDNKRCTYDVALNTVSEIKKLFPNSRISLRYSV